MTPREGRGRDLELRAAHILELAAINGLLIDEVGDPSMRVVQLARRARDAVLRPARTFGGSPGKSCAFCARGVAGRPVRVEPIGRADGGVLVYAGWGCDQDQRLREGNHSFGRG